jgi:hypothetical protein
LPVSTILPLAKFTNPLGGQLIELQQLDYESGGMSLLRLRIREKSRFTIFEMDPQTAQQWGEAMIQWAQTQPVVPNRDSMPPAPTSEGSA